MDCACVVLLPGSTPPQTPHDDDEPESGDHKPSPKKSRKFKKAPGAPKRFRSAFIFFSQQKHKEIQESLAREGSSEKTTSVAKMVSEAWRQMGQEERSKWEKMASDDKERFEKEKASYRGPWTVPIGHRKSKVSLVFLSDRCCFLQWCCRFALQTSTRRESRFPPILTYSRTPTHFILHTFSEGSNCSEAPCISIPSIFKQPKGSSQTGIQGSLECRNF